MSIEKLNIVSDILKRYHGCFSFEVNQFVANENLPQIKNLCEEKNIEFDEVGNILEVKYHLFIPTNLILFDQLNRFTSDLTLKEFSIIKITGEYCYFSSVDDLIFSDNSTEEFKITCQNLFSYYNLYNYLKSDFADHHNSPNREIVIYNSATGIFRIIYDATPKPIATCIKKSIDNLISEASKSEVTQYFKNALVSASQGKDSISIEEIIINANDIISITKRDYALVSKQFNFENFRDSLYKEKEKYFNNIRDILNKIFNQATSIPISISATVFATYKVSDDIVMLSLVMLSFIAYIIFYVKLQLIYKSDIKEIETDFNIDFDIIISKSGLDEITINKEKSKIENKIISSICISNLLISLIIFLGILVLVYISYEILNFTTNQFFQNILSIF